MKPYNKNLKQPSRELRKNMTDAECLLWSRGYIKQLKMTLNEFNRIMDIYITPILSLFPRSYHLILQIAIRDTR
ncbi:hypothetical protein IID10_20285 [candidate division KSB1 bacterium]|nr:hypothetical protein [candidate division KSB1 bacterium]